MDTGTRYISEDRMRGHEDLCAERYKSIAHEMGAIKRDNRWLSSLMIAILLGTLGWSLKAQYDSQQAALHAVQQTSDETVRKLTGAVR